MQDYTTLRSVILCVTGQDIKQLNIIKSLGTWVQLDDQILLFCPEEKSNGIIEKIKKNELTLSNYSTLSQGCELYLVVQEGRSFQKEYPDINIILDKGRFLIAEVNSDRVQEIREKHTISYLMKTLEKDSVIFKRHINHVSRTTPVPEIQSFVDRLNQSRFESYLTRLVSYPTRLSTSKYYKLAVTWASEQLDEMGYVTRVEDFTMGSEISQNVIADKQGGDTERHLIIITAHLDSINHKDGPGASAPGADDNGSGSAGLLEIAYVLKDLPIQHDLRFILFGGEEQGLFGSKQYVDKLSDFDKSRIRVVINMDMIGSMNTPTPTVLLEGAPISKLVMDALGDAAKVYTNLYVQTSLTPYASDHVSFIEAGIPALLTIEGADGANHNEHTSNDTIDLISYELALEILRMNIAFVISQLKIYS